ncbi:DUF6603 domain-containing protein [Nitrosomonas sp.]|uniref:DUF6603 domain-containing protein n=1 Tax=Nitrosomonas sp. TaxID=42353 RepID=UPI0026292BE5|nr:DUF6603 domain-containing protein [Nitrosomonas sp.]
MTSEQESTLGTLAKELVLALKPLAQQNSTADAAELPEFFQIILESVGLRLERTLGNQTIQSIRDLLSSISAVYKTVESLVEQPDSLDLNNIPTAIQALESIISNLQKLNQLQLKAYQADGILIELQDLGQILLEYLITEYLEEQHPAVFNFLAQFGIIEFGDLDADDFNQRLARLRLERIIVFIRDPKVAARDIYGWGDESFNPYRLFAPLVFLLRSVGFPASFAYPTEADGIALGWDGAVDRPELEVHVPLFREASDIDLRAGFAIQKLSSNQVNGGGLAIVPYGIGNTSQKANVGQNWELDFIFSGNVTGRFGLIVSFDQVEIRALDDGANVGVNYDFRITSTLTNKADPGKKIFLLGQSDIAVIEADGAGIALGLQFKNNDAEFFVELPIKGGQISLSNTKSDGFLQKILPKDGIRIDFDLIIGWSNKKGLYFRGGAGLETTLPINKNLFDVLLINSVYLAILAKESGISLAAATSVTLKLGPVTVAIEQMGLKADISFPERGGNLGPVNLGIGFKPPKGAGLVIDASAVVGAGFLEFDPDNAMYSGFVYLEIVKKISVTAVGLITTRMPDGSPGFSLLALVAVQFSPGIQLGYGFTLNGLGGLLGINRTVTVDALRSGLRNGTLGSILFPSDPNKNIARIISDLKAVFPPAEGRFVFGPMVILGWGPNELIKLELGIILELPDPIRLLILGRLSLKLPDEKNPVVRLKLDSLGVIEFATGDVSLDAVLYDSEIKGFTITGEMALRANFGASPGFLLSVGGFHPAFKAPPGFPALQRVAISLATGDNPRLRLAAYMAITTNTVQFGAALEIYAKAGPFSLEGQLSFDALIQFDPFGLAIGLGAMIAIKSGKQVLLCIKLDMNLTGPTPWHAWGEARFTLLFFEVKIPFEVKSGEELHPELPTPVDLLPRMNEALKEPTNWSTQLPQGEHPLVVFREQAKGGGILVHPLAMLQVNQRVAPLNEDIYKFGNATLKDGVQHFKLLVDGVDVQKSDYVQDWFAPAHFRDMTDDEKIAADSFEQKDAGIRFTQEGFSCGAAVIENEMEYETEYSDASKKTVSSIKTAKAPISKKRTGKSSKDAQPYRLTNEFLEQVACLGAVGQSLLLKTGNARYQSDGVKSAVPVFNVKPRSFIVVGGNAATDTRNGNNSIRRKSTASSSKRTVKSQETKVVESYTEALDLLKINRNASPATRARLKIVPL